MDAQRLPRTAYRFGGFTLDLVRGALLASDGAELPLRPKSFAVLQLLAENAGRLLDRSTIMQAVWPDVFVTDDSIMQCIGDIRRALGDEAQQLLRTVPRRGYLFATEVSRAGSAVPEGEGTSSQARPAREPAELKGLATGSSIERRQLTVLLDHRLAVILAIDVVGYARLIERDEAGILQRLWAHRRELIDILIARHGGRIVNAVGDSALCAFASVAEAVGCAIQIQQGMAAREADVPEEERIHLRIGINLGEVIHKDGDLHGGAVNIAARLQQLAEPGGIVIAGAAYDQLRGKLNGDSGFECLGERWLKNIRWPVRVYRVTHGRTEADQADLAPIRSAELPSLAVLPFDEPSGGLGQGGFGGSIAEDIITELARFRGLLVIAGTTSFGCSHQPIIATEIGHRLGARFLVQGSVRRASGQIRITTRLVDAVTGGQLWAERYDAGTRTDTLAVHDEIVATIAATLVGRIEAAGVARARHQPAVELGADGCLLQGIGHLAGYGGNANARAQVMFARAVRLDPGHALARAFLALTLYVEEFLNHAHLGPSLARALELAEEAVELANEDSRCHRILAEIALAAQAFERADHHSQRALELNPNDPHAAAYRSYILAFLGHHEEAIGWMRRAMHLNPFHPGWYWPALGRLLHYAGQHERAIRAFERVATPRFFNLAYWAACHAKLGHAREAEGLVTQALLAKPDLSVGGWFMLQPFRRKEDRRGLIEGLLAAGLPS